MPFEVLGSTPVFKLQRCHWFRGLKAKQQSKASLCKVTLLWGLQLHTNWLETHVSQSQTCITSDDDQDLPGVSGSSQLGSYTSNHFLATLRLPPGPQMCWSLFQLSPQAKGRVTPWTSWQIIPEPTRWETLCRNTYRQVAGSLHVHLFGWWPREWSPHLPCASLFQVAHWFPSWWFIRHCAMQGKLQWTSSQQCLRDLKSEWRARF